MPPIGLICPKCRTKLPIEDAVRHLSELCAVMYGPTVQALVSRMDDERRSLGAGVSASQGSPTSTCRRQILLSRATPYYLDPISLMTAEEGSVWHHALHKRGGQSEGWLTETPLPGPDDIGKPGVRVNPHYDFPELEIWPGVWFSCVVDRHRVDWSEIEDLKTKRPSKNPYPPGEDNAVQLLLADRAARLLGKGEPQRLSIWRYISGSYEPTLTQKRYVIAEWDAGKWFVPVELRAEQAARRTEPLPEFLGEEWLKRHSYAHLLSLQTWSDRLAELIQAGDDAGVDKLLEEVPLDGRTYTHPISGRLQQMFNGTKCLQYCELRNECFRRAGEVVI